MRISERDLVLPALYVISENPGISTSTLIQQLAEILKPTGEDAEILSGRSDTKFSQMVRNLVSHETFVGLRYAKYTSGEDRRSGGTFHITEEGQHYLDENGELIDNLILHGFPYESVVDTMRTISVAKTSGKHPHIVDENIIIQQGRQREITSKAYERSDAVRKAAIKRYRREDDHIVCYICDFDFLEVYGDRGRDYIEIHHEIPLCENEGEEIEVFLHDAVENVKPVCSNCHRMIHRSRNSILSIEEMKKIVN